MLKKYLFFYLKTGGGHYAPAKSVASILEHDEECPIDPILADGMDGAPKLLKKLIIDGYSASQTHMIKAFEFLYGLHKIKPIAYVSRFIVTTLIKNAVKRRIQQERPSVIVNFHFFLIEPIQIALKKIKSDIPVITVVTDPYTAHPLWFLKKNQQMIVFSEQVKNTAVHEGINSNMIKVFPFVIDSKFSVPIKETEKELLKIKHKIDTTKKSILIMGGGDGLPGAAKLIRKMALSKINANVLLVCGRNKKLLNYAEKIKQKYGFTALQIYPFIPFVRELIAVSDLVITKCGASTFMEILLMNKVPLINNYIWEQEKGNMEYICRNKFGAYIRSPNKLVREASQILNNPQVLSSYEKTIKNAELKNGVIEVASYLTSV
jgi:processive 1,2-diacylglycerol beta-glucosyltransferase/1,2-diacylglycerol 3-beta-galactosyltransferase